MEPNLELAAGVWKSHLRRSELKLSFLLFYCIIYINETAMRISVVLQAIMIKFQMSREESCASTRGHLSS